MKVEDNRNRLQRLFDAIIWRIKNGPTWRIVSPESEFRIDHLSLRSGDIIVVKLRGRIPAQFISRAKSDLEPKLPPGVKCVVIDDSISLSVIHPEDLAGIDGGAKAA